MSIRAEIIRGWQSSAAITCGMSWRPGIAWFITLVCCTNLTAMGAALEKRLEESVLLIVEKPEENIRSAPNGEKIGLLFKGAQIEKIGEQGKWVQFKMEGWVWAPSLEAAPAGLPAQLSQAGSSQEEGISAPSLVTRKPRSAIQVNLSQVRELVNDDFGVFYSMDHDQDLQQLIVRIRLSETLTRDALERRQVAIQGQLFDLLAGGVEFNSIRVETNRPDGSGQVGVEVVITDVADLVDLNENAEADADQLRRWKEQSRISTDAGVTWSR
jgi:hypothetical protein